MLLYSIVPIKVENFSFEQTKVSPGVPCASNGEVRHTYLLFWLFSPICYVVQVVDDFHAWISAISSRVLGDSTVTMSLLRTVFVRLRQKRPRNYGEGKQYSCTYWTQLLYWTKTTKTGTCKQIKRKQNWFFHIFLVVVFLFLFIRLWVVREQKTNSFPLFLCVCVFCCCCYKEKTKIILFNK